MKYQAKTQCLDVLIDPSFQGVKRLLVSSFENKNDWESYKRYFLPTIEIKCCNVMIDERIFFWSTKKKKKKWFENKLMITFKKVQTINKMTTQLVVY